jgi:CheY-like chemotaxis protein
MDRLFIIWTFNLGQPSSTILVIDDDPDVLFTTSRLLERANYKVIQGQSGSECLALAGQHRLDLILLDAMLPDIPGIEVCLQLKNNNKTRHIPVILISF